MDFIRKYVAPLLLVLFGWYYSGISLCTHTHVIDGRAVTHSHPGFAEGHSHSTAQFAAINLLTSFDADSPLSPSCIGDVSLTVPESDTTYGAQLSEEDIVSVNTLRGPPQKHLS